MTILLCIFGTASLWSVSANRDVVYLCFFDIFDWLKRLGVGVFIVVCVFLMINLSAIVSPILEYTEDLAAESVECDLVSIV